MASAMAYACVICQERFKTDGIAALGCGHTFHLVCIMQWLQVNKSCPKCRQRTQEKNVISQLFFDNATDDSSAILSDNPDYLKFEVANLRGDVAEVNKQLQTTKERLKTVEVDKDKLTLQIINLTNRTIEKDEVISALKKQIIYLQPYEKKLDASQKELTTLKAQLVTYKKIDLMNSGSAEEADLVLEGVLNSTSSTVDTMRVYMISLKRSFNDVVANKKKLTDANAKMTKEMEQLRKENLELKDKLHHAREELKIRNVGAHSTPCNAAVKSLLKDSPFDVSNVEGFFPPMDDPLTPIYGNTGSRFRFKEVTNEHRLIFDEPTTSGAAAQRGISETIESIVAPASEGGLNVPAGMGKAAEPKLHFQAAKAKPRHYLDEIETFKKFDGFGGHGKVVSQPKTSTFGLGPSAAAGKRTGAVVDNTKGIKRAKATVEARPFSLVPKAPLRPIVAVKVPQVKANPAVEPEIIDISSADESSIQS